MSSNKFSCLIFKLPSLTSSSDPANIPAVPVFLYFVTLLKFLGIKSSNFFQSVNFPKKSLIVTKNKNIPAKKRVEEENVLRYLQEPRRKLYTPMFLTFNMTF